MIFGIYSKEPERLLSEIIKGIESNVSNHMEHWELVNDLGVDYLTQRDEKYYFKILLKPEIIDDNKIRFSFVYHEYADATHHVKCEYIGQLTECILYNFGESIRGIQIYPQRYFNLVSDKLM